ncbi:Nramp family divalent metal transporter [Stieleria varia]|uniref:Manganese transport protein MntH n=1 Tax=Stieleria varia TaxID=2528005 RepID=A0A5C5ZUQ6_9BACT|nr:Nramp family divalent metal transporter [Stieleria varia]TWT91294.1 manganese transport protein MntH [Stieleria varia]
MPESPSPGQNSDDLPINQQPPEGDALDPSSQDPVSQSVDPPTTLFRMLACVGPGLIVAGSIVGSGELIATTKTGAEAGFSLLWLILLGCVIKVFAQIEFGRYAITSGKTTLQALDEVPGPRLAGRGNWLVWYWVLMWLASISQLGGIVGGVGQALAISAPITQAGQEYNVTADDIHMRRYEEYRSQVVRDGGAESTAVIEPVESVDAELMDATKDVVETEASRWSEYNAKHGVDSDGNPSVPHDAAIWAAIVAVLTSLVLVWGRYGLIQSLSTILVASFTLLTVFNLFLLQGQPEFSVRWSEFWSGLMPSLPERTAGINPIGTALATFGIIGVGAAELVVYPYWCLEKGYGKFTGVNDGSPAWRERAAGWMRVMHIDAWGSMIVYTFATIAFYLLGAAVLHRLGLNPEKNDMVRTLAVMFRPVFSEWAAMVFLFGAFAVLYSTFFVANASHARTFSDALRVVGLIAEDEVTRERWIRILSGVFPILCLVIFLAFQAPAQLVLLSGVAQGIMLPMLAGAALFFRYKRVTEGLTPGRWWDLMLWLSAAAMLVTGVWTVVDKFLN